MSSFERSINRNSSVDLKSTLLLISLSNILSIERQADICKKYYVGVVMYAYLNLIEINEYTI